MQRMIVLLLGLVYNYAILATVKRPNINDGSEEINVHDVLCNAKSSEDVTSRSRSGRRTRESATESEELYDDEQDEFVAQNLLRTKREPSKNEVDVPPGYSIYAIPKLPDKSTMPVFLAINISKLLDWNELEETIKIDMEFKVMWTDFKILHFHNSSLQHPGNGEAMIDTLTYDYIKQNRKTNNNPALLMSIWKPNLFMEGLLSVRQPVLMARPLTIRFIPELGWFEYITRIQVKMDCSMDFHYYPADTQTCYLSVRGCEIFVKFLNLESRSHVPMSRMTYTVEMFQSSISMRKKFIRYQINRIFLLRRLKRNAISYTKADLNLTWYKTGVYLNDLSLQSFDARVDELTHYDLVKSDDPAEVHDVLGFKIVARRKLSYHLIQTYLASSFYIVITTLCFLLPSTMVEARIGISMTTLLTLTAMFGAVRESTPIVSYTKAIDTWMVGCIFFVFLTLFQFTFHIWLKHVKKTSTESNSNGIENEAYELEDPPKNHQKNGSTDELDERTNSRAGPVFSPTTLKIYERMSNLLEAYSFPLFLSIFIIYTAVYWTWLLTASDYFHWNINSTLNRIDD